MSFLNFRHQKKLGDQPLHWARADLDGAPYIGTPPLMNQQELEAKSERVGSFCFGLFDTSQPEQRHFENTYQEVMERVVGGWYQLLMEPQRRWVVSKRTGKLKVMVYIEWTVPAMKFNESSRGFE